MGVPKENSHQSLGTKALDDGKNIISMHTLILTDKERAKYLSRMLFYTVVESTI